MRGSLLDVRDTKVKDGASAPEEFTLMRAMNMPDVIMSVM